MLEVADAVGADGYACLGRAKKTSHAAERVVARLEHRGGNLRGGLRGNNGLRNDGEPASRIETLLIALSTCSSASPGRRTGVTVRLSTGLKTAVGAAAIP